MEKQIKEIKLWIVKSNEFYIKPKFVPRTMSVKNFHYLEKDVYETETFSITHYFQIFWLWWILAVDLKNKNGYEGKTKWKQIK